MDSGKLSTSAKQLRLTTLGLNFSFSIVVGLAMGWGAKKLFHLGDWVIMAGILLGILSSYLILFEDLKSLQPPPKNPPNENKT